MALDGSGRAGTTTASAAAQAKGSSLSMQIVAAIPPSPPSIESMGSGMSSPTHFEPRARGKHHHGGHHEEAQGGGQSHSKIEGSVDAVAQRIFHRITARLRFDRERFNG